MMFKRPDATDLTIYLDGVPLGACDGDSIATALLAHGILSTRHTAISGGPRGPYCMMGACFECLAVVDGTAGVQTCLAAVRDGMRIERQHGARSLADSP